MFTKLWIIYVQVHQGLSLFPENSFQTKQITHNLFTFTTPATQPSVRTTTIMGENPIALAWLEKYYFWLAGCGGSKENGKPGWPQKHTPLENCCFQCCWYSAAGEWFAFWHIVVYTRIQIQGRSTRSMYFLKTPFSPFCAFSLLDEFRVRVYRQGATLASMIKKSR